MQKGFISLLLLSLSQLSITGCSTDFGAFTGTQVTAVSKEDVDKLKHEWDDMKTEAYVMSKTDKRSKKIYLEIEKMFADGKDGLSVTEVNEIVTRMDKLRAELNKA